VGGTFGDQIYFLFFGIQGFGIMEPHAQSPWYLHEIPSYAKASEGYPPVAKSAEASILRHMNNSATAYAFIHGQSPWSSA